MHATAQRRAKMEDLAALIEEATLSAARNRIARRIEHWGLQDIIHVRLLAPLRIESIKTAVAHELEAIESLLPTLSIWRDSQSNVHNPVTACDNPAASTNTTDAAT